MAKDRRKTVPRLVIYIGNGYIQAHGENMSDQPRTAQELSDRDKLELAEFLGSEDLSGAIEVEHKTRRLTEDECWFIHAADFYDRVEKHPMTGELHRKHASTLMWFLDHVTDEGIARQYRDRIGHRSTRLTSARAVFARLVEIIVERRGLQSLANTLSQ